MFAFFPLATAVANIRPFVDRLRTLPAFVTDERSGEGFARAVDHLLAMKNLLSLRESERAD